MATNVGFKSFDKFSEHLVRLGWLYGFDIYEAGKVTTVVVRYGYQKFRTFQLTRSQADSLICWITQKGYPVINATGRYSYLEAGTLMAIYKPLYEKEQLACYQMLPLRQRKLANIFSDRLRWVWEELEDRKASARKALNVIFEEPAE